jgi:hypothetical protein
MSGSQIVRRIEQLSKLYIQVILRDRAKNNALLHKPLVAINDGTLRKSECRTWELLACLRKAGSSDEEVSQGQKQIEESGSTVFESSTITDADLEPLRG